MHCTNTIMDFNIMDTTIPITEIITRRFSCRTYINKPIPKEKRILIEEFISANKIGPFKTTPRFHLISASAEDHKSLKGLGTYGFIKGA